MSFSIARKTSSAHEMGSDAAPLDFDRALGVAEMPLAPRPVLMLGTWQIICIATSTSLRASYALLGQKWRIEVDPRQSEVLFQTSAFARLRLNLQPGA